MGMLGGAPNGMYGGQPEKKSILTKNEKPPLRPDESEESKAFRKKWGIADDNELFREEEGKYFMGDEPFGKWWNRQMSELEGPGEYWYDNM